MFTSGFEGLRVHWEQGLLLYQVSGWNDGQAGMVVILDMPEVIKADFLYTDVQPRSTAIIHKSEMEMVELVVSDIIPLP